MLKVMTLVGTRPELIKMSRVIAEFDRHTRHVLVHTGQNFDYELNQVFFDELEIRKPDYFLDAAGENAARTIGQVIIKTDEILEKEQPEAILVYGDTNSGLGVIAAKRRRIPVFHMEAGNRCFDQRVPEVPGLGHTDEGVVHRGVTVGVVLLEHLADDTRAFTVFSVENQPFLVHGVQDAPMHGFESVVHVGQRAPHDHTHGVIAERCP